MTKRLQVFSEDVVYQDVIEIDEANCVVKNVKVAGLVSRNKRRYTEPALREAVTMYEGCKVNVDHPDPPRPGEKTKPRLFVDRFGKLKNARWTPTGIRADLHYNPEHEHAKSFLWWAKNDPASVGFSHNILGVAYENEQGETVIEKIEQVKSVDLVADPATTQGLVEAAGDLEFNFEETPDAPTEAPGEEPAGPGAGGGEDPLSGESDDECDHLCNAATSIIKNKDMDAKTKLDKLRRILGLIHDDESPKQPKTKNAVKMPPEKEEADPLPGSAGDSPGEPEKKLMEAFIEAVELDNLLNELEALRAEKAQREKRERILTLCREAALPAEAQTGVFLESLLGHDELTIKMLIDDKKAVVKSPATAAKKPVSSPPGTGPAGSAEEDLKKKFMNLFRTEE